MRRPFYLVAVIATLLSVITLRGQQVSQTPDDNNPRPEIPDADRYASGRVFLERADKLLKTSPYVDYQIVTGNVMFRRGDMFMYCDSAHFYDATSSLQAFGNVRMEQGDTLFVYADELEYTDSIELAVLYADPGKKVRLINRNVELKTDIFNYDMGIELGYYEVGGELDDKTNKLTSIYGEYAPKTKDAIFRNNVHLVGYRENDTLNIWTQSLLYNTDTKIAELDQPSTITSRDGTIYTANGTYNTETSISDLYDRSLVVTKTGRTLEGDTLFYDRNAGYGEAWGNMILTDTINRMKLIGDYGFYNELTDSAFVTGHALAVDYSKADSLTLHGDTIMAFRVITYPDTTGNILPESVRAELELQALNALNNSTEIETDSIAQDIIIDNTIEAPTKVDNETSDEIDVDVEIEQDVQNAKDQLPEFNEETKNEVPDSIVENTVVIENITEDNIGILQDSIPLELPVLKEPELPDTTHHIVAYPNVRFFRSDLQGLCDSMTFIQKDSMLYMDIDPVVWSGERQITGSQIRVHMNDSTADRIYIPSEAFMAEDLGEGFFNQLSGRELEATLEDGSLKHVDVSGNVLIIYFPMEEDSTYNKVANAESSFLAADFANQELQRLKMWPESNESITPLYLAKKTNFRLQNFVWISEERPTGHHDVLPREPIKRPEDVNDPDTVSSAEETESNEITPAENETRNDKPESPTAM